MKRLGLVLGVFGVFGVLAVVAWPAACDAAASVAVVRRVATEAPTALAGVESRAAVPSHATPAPAEASTTVSRVVSLGRVRASNETTPIGVAILVLALALVLELRLGPHLRRVRRVVGSGRGDHRRHEHPRGPPHLWRLHANGRPVARTDRFCAGRGPEVGGRTCWINDVRGGLLLT